MGIKSQESIGVNKYGMSLSLPTVSSCDFTVNTGGVSNHQTGGIKFGNSKMIVL